MKTTRKKLYKKYRKEIKHMTELSPIEGDIVFKHFELVQNSVNKNEKIINEISKKQNEVNSYYKQLNKTYFVIVLVLFFIFIISFLIWGLFVFEVL